MIVGMGFTPFALRLDQWKALGQRYGLAIYPSLNTRPLRRFHQSDPCAWHEYIRAAAAWWWHNGVDGTYLFNLFTYEGECGLEKEAVHAPLREIGDPAALVGKNKRYGIESLKVAGCSDALAKTANPMIVHEVLSAAIY